MSFGATRQSIEKATTELSEREALLLAAINEGKRGNELASVLGCSVKTVQHMRKRIREKQELAEFLGRSVIAV